MDLNKIIDFCLYDLVERIEMLSLRLVQVLMCEVKVFALKGEFEKLKMLVFHSSVFIQQAAVPNCSFLYRVQLFAFTGRICCFLDSCDRCNSSEIIFSCL